MASHYFGPLGAMRPLVVSAGVAIETSRASSEFVSSGGVRHVQRGRAAPRTWTVGRQWQGSEWARTLSMAAHGLIGQCWLYDVAEARENMVPASLSAGVGPLVPVSGHQMKSLSLGHEVKIPALAGRLYSVSAWCEEGGVMLTYESASASGSVSSLNGSGSASFTPQADTILTVTVKRGAVSGLRINEGSFDGSYAPGYGTPCRVSVEDPQRTLQMVTDSTRSDYQVVLSEVGKPGKL